MKKLYKLVALTLFMAFGIGVKAQKINELVVGIGHTQMSGKLDELSEPLQKYLSEQMGMKVRVFYPKNIFEMLEMIEKGQIHVADMNPFGYLLASEEGKTEILSMRGYKDGKIETYNSCLIVNAKNTVKTLNDFKNATEQKQSIFFVNPASTSGHLLPRLYLNSLDLQAEAVFKDIVFKDSHQNVIDAIKQTPDAIGACSYTFLQEQIEAGTVKKEDIRIIWTSESIPSGPVVIQKSLPNALKAKLQEAYLNIPKNEALFKKFQTGWRNNKVTYVKGEEKAFDYLRKMTNDSEDLIFILNFYKE